DARPADQAIRRAFFLLDELFGLAQRLVGNRALRRQSRIRHSLRRRRSRLAFLSHRPLVGALRPCLLFAALLHSHASMAYADRTLNFGAPSPYPASPSATFPSAAWAAASRAIGTRNGEQET